MKIAAICDNDTAVGLRLAGLQEIYIPDDTVKLWDQISERDDFGIVFITEKLAEEIGKHLEEFRIRNNIPIVVEIPDKKGRIKDHIDFVSRLIKKAVGVEISKEK